MLGLKSREQVTSIEILAHGFAQQPVATFRSPREESIVTRATHALHYAVSQFSTRRQQCHSRRVAIAAVIEL